MTLGTPHHLSHLCAQAWQHCRQQHGHCRHGHTALVVWSFQPGAVDSARTCRGCMISNKSTTVEGITSSAATTGALARRWVSQGPAALHHSVVCGRWLVLVIVGPVCCGVVCISKACACSSNGDWVQGCAGGSTVLWPAPAAPTRATHHLS